MAAVTYPVPGPRRASPCEVLFWTAAVSAIPLLALAQLALTPQGFDWPGALSALLAPDGSVGDIVIRHLALPRAMAALLAGAALGAGGALLQGALRNRLASPGIMGVNSGAHLALVVALLAMPGLPPLLAIAPAFLGGVGAGAFALLIAGGVRSGPVRMALAGVIVSFAFGAVQSTLSLFFEHDVAGLFLWGAGSPIQPDWAAPRLAGLLVPAILSVACIFARALDVMALGDDAAAGLGVDVGRARIGMALLGCLLSACAVLLAGPVSFIGLVAPNLLRLAGIASHRALLLRSAVLGAGLLLAADLVAKALSQGGTLVPAGIVTALIGAPVFAWFIRRLPAGSGGHSSSGLAPSAVSQARHRRALVLIVLLAAGAGLASLLLGAAPLGPGELIDTVRGMGGGSAALLLELRASRLLAALGAGALLGIAGLFLQATLRNPLASPELMGLSQGAALAAVAASLFLPEGIAGRGPTAVAGAFACLLVVLWLARGGRLSSLHLALAGMAIAVTAQAAASFVLLEANLQVAEALVWLSGSLYGAGAADGPLLLAAAAASGAAGLLLSRHLDLLALDEDHVRALGVSAGAVRLAALVLAVFATGLAVSVVGAVVFIGLVAPHAARLLSGPRHARLVPMAALIGATLLAGADLAGRTAFAPREIPAGLVAAFAGAPYFLWLLRRLGPGRA